MIVVRSCQLSDFGWLVFVGWLANSLPWLPGSGWLALPGWLAGSGFGYLSDYLAGCLAGWLVFAAARNVTARV